ncbi:hypothetical protein H9P43_008685 [Blastocladiella emersonii ATCC 22665]|nr:hypothetical protein H9P43_008685 [Blastocladiella emersonii ATCC 22665]
MDASTKTSLAPPSAGAAKPSLAHRRHHASIIAPLSSSAVAPDAAATLAYLTTPPTSPPGGTTLRAMFHGPHTPVLPAVTMPLPSPGAVVLDALHPVSPLQHVSPPHGVRRGRSVSAVDPVVAVPVAPATPATHPAEPARESHAAMEKRVRGLMAELDASIFRNVTSSLTSFFIDTADLGHFVSLPHLGASACPEANLVMRLVEEALAKSSRLLCGEPAGLDEFGAALAMRISSVLVILRLGHTKLAAHHGRHPAAAAMASEFAMFLDAQVQVAGRHGNSDHAAKPVTPRARTVSMPAGGPHHHRKPLHATTRLAKEPATTEIAVVIEPLDEAHGGGGARRPVYLMHSHVHGDGSGVGGGEGGAARAGGSA